MTDICGMLALVFLIGSPIFAMVIGAIMEGEGYTNDGYGAGIVLCLGLAAVFGIIYGIGQYNKPRTLYDTEIRMHYVDGHSQVVRKDSIEYDDLPHIVEGTISHGGWPPGNVRYEKLGIYSLYYGDNRYHGVIRFEYLHKQKYEVSSEVYHAMMERRHRK